MIPFPDFNLPLGRNVEPFHRRVVPALGHHLSRHRRQPLQPELGRQVERRLIVCGDQPSQLVADRFAAERLGLRLFEHFEPRVDAGLDRPRPQQRGAERMNGADPRGIELAGQRSPVRRVGHVGRDQPLLAFLADPVAHFARGPLGKRDRHQAANIVRPQVRRAARIEIIEEPLGEHEGLAAACAGRQRHRHVARGDGAGLLLGPPRGGAFCRVRGHGVGTRGGSHDLSSDRAWFTRQTVLKAQ